ncbi:MAG: gephyrin-like molybdotransferase Glp [Limnobacter sp.]|uniref:molybdopterin molybdotransferase MoeA n=1 Tax=Limnobacter sp. TaxID=2003368 RepID=UPI00391ABD97
MLTLDQLLDDLWPRAMNAERPTETFPLALAQGRVLAQDVVSSMNVPAFDNSAMDGYAVRVAEIHEGAPMSVSQRIPAGANPGPLAVGTVARIFTGAQVPEGADAVVMQEQVQELDDGRVVLANQPKFGQSIRRRGEDIAEGATVLHAGTVLGPLQLGLLASVGVASVQVYRPLKVGVMVTGSELQAPGQALGPGEIYNSNEFVWVGFLSGMAVEVHTIGIVPDDLQATVEAIRNLSNQDVIISSGGVSVGEEDHVKPALEQLGALESWKVAMKPGKPVAFGHVKRPDESRCWFFGLPGNPVSSALSFLLIVKPFLGLLSGRRSADCDWRLALRPVQAGFDWARPDPRREEFLRVHHGPDGAVSLFPNQGSGVLSSLHHSSALVRLAPGQQVEEGQTVMCVTLRDLMAWQ